MKRKHRTAGWNAHPGQISVPAKSEQLWVYQTFVPILWRDLVPPARTAGRHIRGTGWKLAAERSDESSSPTAAGAPDIRQAAPA